MDFLASSNGLLFYHHCAHNKTEEFYETLVFFSRACVVTVRKLKSSDFPPLISIITGLPFIITPYGIMDLCCVCVCFSSSVGYLFLIMIDWRRFETATCRNSHSPTEYWGRKKTWNEKLWKVKRRINKLFAQHLMDGWPPRSTNSGGGLFPRLVSGLPKKVVYGNKIVHGMFDVMRLLKQKGTFHIRIVAQVLKFLKLGIEIGSVGGPNDHRESHLLC